MIIKYYSDGWNYIDNAEDLLWVNKELDFKNWKGHIYEDSGGGKYIKGELKDLVDEAIMGLTWSVSDEEVQPKIYQNKVSMKTIADALERKDFIYLRVLRFTRGSDYHILVFSEVGYILNDNGQTVEKIG